VIGTRISKINGTKRRRFRVGFIPVWCTQIWLPCKLPEQYISTSLSTALHRNLKLETQRMVKQECLTQEFIALNITFCSRDQSQVDMSQKLLFLIYSWFSPTWLLPWRRLLSAMLVPKQTCSIERSQWERKLKSVLCVVLCCGSRSDWDKLIEFYRIP